MRKLTLILWGICSLFFCQTTMGQCDSTLYETHLIWETCPGESIYFNNTEILPDTTLSFTFQAADGCDSIVLIEVVSISIDTGQVQLAACRGDSVWYNGHAILAGESQLFTFNFSDGCDSSYLVSVAIVPDDTVYVGLEVCGSETIDYHGFTFAEGDQKEIVLQNRYGCDSVVFVSVTGLSVPDFHTGSQPSCPDAAQGQIEITITEGTPPFLCALDSDPFQSTTFFPYLKAGEYAVRVMDGSGCVRQKTATVGEREKLEVEVEPYILPCGDAGVTLRPAVVSHAGPLQWEWPDGSDQEWLRA
ncbi:MAG TPA: hypothetical protein ENJ20_01350, partial [Bacteroidetes bacterium]|nr:hypothetical protein [Bacteroidota bacterium]